MEFIGFIISVFALIYLFFKQQSIVKYRQNHQEKINDEFDEDESLDEILSIFGKETRGKKEVKTPPPPVPPYRPSSHQVNKQPKKVAASSLENYRLSSQIEKRKIKSPLEGRQIKPSYAQSYEEVASEVKVPYLSLGEERIAGPSRVEIAVRRLANRRDLIIFQEIIDKPKSMRPNP